METLKSLNLAAAFVLELGMLAAYIYWGFHLDANIFYQIIAGVGVPLVVTILWGVWLAPNADLRLGTWWLIVLKTTLFGLATLALMISGQPDMGLVLLVAYAVSETLGLIWKQEEAAS
jgi:uncharacterized protein DUF2568